ncbi:hypothetical protein RUM43_011179 [Polyplax serrata]|uniref:DnaJ homolog subfamily C member 17 n=1 Tax=Polyplax serrata TaxID=468196 RepID=A0AAN8S7R5_POLSC
MGKLNLEEVDLYGLLGLKVNANINDIRTAYRKKALKCHPDKNPDNPKAAELFHQLTEALEILLDESARAAYDKLLKGKEAARLRYEELDEKRKKFKEDLEARERAHFAKNKGQKTEEQKLQEEIARLQKEGAKLVEEEIRKLQEEVNRELSGSEGNTEDGSQYKIKIQWNVGENDDGGYNEEILERIFRKYGDIAALAVSQKKGKQGLALIEFKEKKAAELAIKIELGLIHNPLKLKWVNKDLRMSHKSNISAGSSLVTERDYESLVLRKMRQAEERKRLIEKMMKEDAESN